MNNRAYTLLIILSAALTIAYLFVPSDLDKLVVIQLVTVGILAGR